MTAFTDVKTHNVKLVLTTVHEVVSFPFTITVTNTAPHFTKAPPTDIQIAHNSLYSIDLTNTYVDDESNVITIRNYFTPPGGLKTLIISSGSIFTTISTNEIKITPKSR